MGPSLRSSRRVARFVPAVAVVLTLGCAPDRDPAGDPLEAVEARVWEFHAADTARDAEAVLALLWPDFVMVADGTAMDFAAVEEGARAFMPSLALFHTVWSDLHLAPIGRDLVASTFHFRDSLVSTSGEVTRSRGPTTLLWERRGGEWRARYGVAAHYPIPDPP